MLEAQMEVLKASGYCDFVFSFIHTCTYYTLPNSKHKSRACRIDSFSVQ